VNAVHVVVPEGVHDPERPSGGNTYDRRICAGLAASGWAVHEHAVPGPWPRPDAAALAALAGVLAKIPDGAVVLLDGLVASTVPELLVPQSGRLCLVVLVHMPLGGGFPGGDAVHARALEGPVLASAGAVIATSRWTRQWLLDTYALPPERVHVAEPGVDPAELAEGTPEGGELLCVGAYTQDKGYDVLLASLAIVRDRPWHCVCVGTTAGDASFVDHLGSAAATAGVDDRVRFTGPLAGADLDRAYSSADVLVLASRAETYGMVVTEALARGLPVITTAVGGLPEALGEVADGSRPGLLVPPGDPWRFAVALRFWLTDAEVRERLRLAARERRAGLLRWSDTTDRISRVLTRVTS
jgi:glycosyltransferase involved in cell wall biosynthesis